MSVYIVRNKNIKITDCKLVTKDSENFFQTEEGVKFRKTMRSFYEKIKKQKCPWCDVIIKEFDFDYKCPKHNVTVPAKCYKCHICNEEIFCQRHEDYINNKIKEAIENNKKDNCLLEKLFEDEEDEDNFI